MFRILNSTWAIGTPPALRSALVESLDARLREPIELFRTHERSTVGRIRIQGTDLVVKRFNATTFYTRFGRLFTTNPARRAWNNAGIVQELGIGTPRNIACIQTITRDFWPVSYLISEYLPGISSDRYFADKMIPVEDKYRVAEAICGAITRLHAAGYIHGDLKGRNILVHRGIPNFIDLDTLQLRRTAINLQRGMRKDCERLKRTVPEVATLLGEAVHA